MTILCGTDFTERSAAATVAAAALAARTSQDLLLVHVLDFPPLQAFLPDGTAQPIPSIEKFIDQETAVAKERLSATAERMSRFGVKIRTAVLSGIADEALVAHSVKTKASLIAIGALGRRSGGLWRLGGTADRVAQMSKTPSIVVRSSEPFERWATADEKLRILAAVDLTAPSDAAIRWLVSFASQGPSSIVLAHVHWPPEQKRGKSGIPIGKGHVDVEAAVEAEIKKRFAVALGSLACELRIVGGLGRPADHLLQIAEAEHADLIVVGNHQRKGLERMWHGSVSHGIVERATTNVACVPSQ